MRLGLGLFVAASLFLAGCASSTKTESSSTGPEGSQEHSSEPTTEALTSHATTGPTTSGTTTSSSSGSANHPPTGTVTVAIAPALRVNFTLTGGDQDADLLSWTLDVNGDGSADFHHLTPATFPTTVNYTYAAAGHFNVTYTISDGKAQTTYHAAVNLTSSASGAVVTGSTALPASPFPSLALGANGCEGFDTGQNNLDCVYGELAATLAGHKFKYTSDTSGPDYEFWDACDPTGTPTQTAGGAATGTVPAGTGCVIMWFNGAGTGTFTMTVS